MFKQWRSFVSGIIFTLVTMILAGSVFASGMGTSINAYFNNIKIFLNGKEIETKDAKGNIVEPFILDGTTYVPLRAVAESFNKLVRWDEDLKQVKIYDTEIDAFWDNLVTIPAEYTGLDIYWRHIDDEIMGSVDKLIKEYGVEVLFKGLKSTNVYSQYYCINRLVEFYNNDDIRIKAIDEISPFLNNRNNTLKKAAEFTVDVLSKKFDSPYIVHAMDDIKIFAIFNDYSDYGSYNELWIIRDDKLSKLHSFNNLQVYIDTGEPIKLSPNRDKITVQTSSRRSSSINIIDLKTGKVSPEIITMAIEKAGKDNKGYNNTYPEGQYNWGGNIIWIDNNTIEFEANLAYNYMDIMVDVIVRYNFLDDSLEYKRKAENGKDISITDK